MQTSEQIQKKIDEIQFSFETEIEKLQKLLEEAKEKERKKSVYPVLKLVRKFHQEGSEIYKVVQALESWAIKHGYKGYHNYNQTGRKKQKNNGTQITFEVK